jgi:hypothetical protein
MPSVVHLLPIRIFSTQNPTGMVKMGVGLSEYPREASAAGFIRKGLPAMTRMSREFSLVLLGAGLLTAGYFMWPEQDFEKRAEEQANNRVGGRRGTTGHVLFIGHFGGSSSVSGARSPAMASVSKSGFGSIGARVGGGGG